MHAKHAVRRLHRSKTVQLACMLCMYVRVRAAEQTAIPSQRKRSSVQRELERKLETTSHRLRTNESKRRARRASMYSLTGR